MVRICLLDNRPMVRQLRHLIDRPAMIGAAEGHVLPIWLEVEFAVRPMEAIEKVPLPERRLAVNPAVGIKLGQGAALRYLQHLVDQLARAHAEAAVLGTNALGERRNHFVIIAALAWRLDQLRPENDVLVAAAAIDVVVLEERSRRQHDVGYQRGLGQELLVYAHE